MVEFEEEDRAISLEHALGALDRLGFETFDVDLDEIDSLNGCRFDHFVERPYLNFLDDVAGTRLKRRGHDRTGTIVGRIDQPRRSRCCAERDVERLDVGDRGSGEVRPEERVGRWRRLERVDVAGETREEDRRAADVCADVDDGVLLP